MSRYCASNSREYDYKTENYHKHQHQYLLTGNRSHLYNSLTIDKDSRLLHLEWSSVVAAVVVHAAQVTFFCVCPAENMPLQRLKTHYYTGIKILFGMDMKQ